MRHVRASGAAVTVEFEHFGLAFVGRGNFYPDGRLAEVFLTGGKTGTQLQIAMQDSAVAASLALQHGAPAETLRNAYLKTDDGRPAGPLGHLFEILEDGAVLGERPVF